MEFKEPLITVITVSFNSSLYIEDTIKSVLAQTYRNFEYIIIDDCSTDDTWNLISNYKDPRIVSCQNQINLKEYPNRNKAIDMARGEYLIFIDGDDIIYPHALSTFLFYMEKFPRACMAIQKGFYNNIVFPIQLESKDQYINYFFGKNNLLVSSFASNFFRTSFLKENKLSTTYISGDDEIRLRLAANYPVLYIPGWLSWPRETPGQASSKITERSALTQTIKYVEEILLLDNSISKDIELKSAILIKIKHRLRALIWKSILKGDLIGLKHLFKLSGFQLSELFLITKPKVAYQDIFSNRTSSSPFSEFT